MSADHSRVRRACPGVAAPMATGDGLLMRVRHPIGGLDAGQAQSIAEVARRFGSGVLELTSRGNLQLRGLDAAGLEPARAELEGAGLADRDPAAEAVRNVLAAPVTDIDPEAAMDVQPVARDLVRALGDHPRLRALPPKVGVVVEAGGGLPLDGVPADLRLEACTALGGVWFRVALGASSRTATVLGWTRAENVVDVALAVFERFVALREGDVDPPGRLAGAVARWGPEALTPPGLERVLPGGDWVAARIPGYADAGMGTCLNGRAFGIAFPFGALRAEALQGLAEHIRAHDGRLRLTPWRSLLLTGVPPVEPDRVAEWGGVTDPDDPRLAVSACIGQMGCSAGSTATRADAERAGGAACGLLAGDGQVHVSGCDKHCGRPANAQVLLTAWEGRYELSLQRAPARWETVLTRLAPGQVEPALAALDAIAREEGGGHESGLEALQRLEGTALTRRMNAMMNNGDPA
ncbi:MULTISPECIES: precorrin-3B synthase [unclassified Thioalkalivibrio]|uniref:precorrin-3B synthase n=1 Tax=unclassified Thioalkalivibrio TaxID=2621013 RepID=UPI000363D9E5|nr:MULTISPECIES: precorrin-3B synthase [unclassified Thioalkalivibrio]